MEVTVKVNVPDDQKPMVSNMPDDKTDLVLLNLTNILFNKIISNEMVIELM